MAEPFRDYYQLLGVEPFADLDEIRRAWRRMAKQLHPDRNPESQLAEQRFKQVHAAYRTLSEPALRARYDELYSRRSRRMRPGSTQEPDRSSRPRGAEQERRSAQPGAGGRGAGTSSEAGAAAGTQKSRAEAPRPQSGQDVRQVVALPLDRFEGGGRIILTIGGHVPLDVALPNSVVPGDELVVPGRGLPGRQGGAPGRLILELRPHLAEDVRLEGSDLVQALRLDALLLMTGTQATILHPAGRHLELRIPSGTQSGQRLRLRGQGLPTRQGRGDLVLEVQVHIQPATGFRTRRLAEKLLRLLGAD